MFSLQYPIIRITLIFVLGLLSASFFSLPIIYSLIVTAIAFGILFVSAFVFNKKIFFLRSLSVYLLFYGLGFVVWHFHQPQNHPDHYTALGVQKKSAWITGTIDQVVSQSDTLNKYLLKIATVDSQKAKGKVLLRVTGKNTVNIPKVGDVIQVYASIQPIGFKQHPSQFDYGKYLKNKGVLHQIKTKDSHIWIDSSHVSFEKKTASIKEKIAQQLIQNGCSNTELGIIKALFFGDKYQIDNALKSSYEQVGVLHILAISGLHIGLLLVFLQTMVSPLKRIRYGKSISVGIVLITLWLVAFFTGLSPSVVRSVAMFTFLTIAMQSGRTHNIYNALFGSAFVLILFKPQFLFDVGFQLSYAAVLSIVAIYPLLFPKIKATRQPLKYIWDIIKVSLAAQIGILPLSLFYFHQFSGLFLLGNLLVIPLLSVILIIGIPLLFFSLWIDIPVGIQIFIFLVEGLNKTISHLGKYTDWVFKAIYYDGYLLIFSYIIIVGLIAYGYSKKGQYVIVSLIGILLLQLSYLYIQTVSEDEVVVFNSFSETLLIHKATNQLTVYQQIPKQNKTIQAYCNSVKHDTLVYQSLSNYRFINGKKWLVIDESGVYLASRKPDVVLLTKSSRVNLDRLIADLRPTYIYADGSNYPSSIALWKKTCAQKNIPFQTTFEKGYVMIE